MSTSFHVRSNSLPSKPHPFTSQFDEHLNILKSSETTSSSSLGQSLNSLQHLYDGVDKVLQLPFTQQSLVQEKQKKFFQDLLDRSLVLLDMCSTAKDSLSQTKESTLELQSILCRRHGGEVNSDEIKKYLNSRKIVKKAIYKAMKNLRVNENCINDEDHKTKAKIGMLNEAEAMALMVFESLLSFVSRSRPQSKLRAIVSKVMQLKRIACEKEEACLNEFEKVDAELLSISSKKTMKSDDIFPLQSHLKDQEMCIQDLEEGIECISRRLIKTRVSFLNILNN